MRCSPPLSTLSSNSALLDSPHLPTNHTVNHQSSSSSSGFSIYTGTLHPSPLPSLFVDVLRDQAQKEISNLYEFIQQKTAFAPIRQHLLLIIATHALDSALPHAHSRSPHSPNSHHSPKPFSSNLCTPPKPPQPTATTTYNHIRATISAHGPSFGVGQHSCFFAHSEPHSLFHFISYCIATTSHSLLAPVALKKIDL